MTSIVIPIDRPKYVRAEAIAARYGISKATILRYAHKGTIPAKRFANGGSRGIWMFDPEAVDAALDSNAAEAKQHVG